MSKRLALSAAAAMMVALLGAAYLLGAIEPTADANGAGAAVDAAGGATQETADSTAGRNDATDPGGPATDETAEEDGADSDDGAAETQEETNSDETDTTTNGGDGTTDGGDPLPHLQFTFSAASESCTDATLVEDGQTGVAQCDAQLAGTDLEVAFSSTLVRADLPTRMDLHARIYVKFVQSSGGDNTIDVYPHMQCDTGYFWGGPRLSVDFYDLPQEDGWGIIEANWTDHPPPSDTFADCPVGIGLKNEDYALGEKLKVRLGADWSSFTIQAVE